MPRYSSSAGAEAVELAATAGLVLDDWQAWALTQALGERRDGRWAALEVAVLAPRQNGKGAILEARELAGLFLFDEQLIIHSAHEFKTAVEGFRRILALIEGRDDLRRRVKRVTTAHGDEGIELLSGQRLKFLARSQRSGRGFAADCVVLDEAYALSATMLGALLPTLSAVPNPQVWYTSSAGDETAEVLAAIRQRGLEGESPRLAYMEWSASDDCDLDDVRAWAQANPGLGTRISPEFVASERETLDAEQFARERLGIWRGSAVDYQLIPRAAWQAVQDADASPTGPMAFGLDVAPDRGRAAIVAASQGAVELIVHREGTAWVVPRAVELARKWTAPIVIDGGGPAASLADDIERAGASVRRLVSADVAAACARLYDAIVQHQDIKVRPHQALTAAAAGVARRGIGDRFVFSRTGSGADITPLYAAALALAVVRSQDVSDVTELIW